jgi:hypothetical protein
MDLHTRWWTWGEAADGAATRPGGAGEPRRYRADERCPACGRNVPPGDAGHAPHCPWGR